MWLWSWWLDGATAANSSPVPANGPARCRQDDTPARAATVVPAMMPDVEDVEVVVAHSERATLRVGDVFLKVDADQTRTDVEYPQRNSNPRCRLERAES